MRNLKAILELYGDEIVRGYTDKLKQSKASGDLIESVSAKVTVDGDSYSITISLLDYWKYIEYGRTPGTFPNIESLMDWVIVKPIVPQPYTLPSGREVIPSLNQIVFLIGRKIQEDGIEPKPYLEKTLDELQKQMIHDIKDALIEDFIEQYKSNRR